MALETVAQLALEPGLKGILKAGEFIYNGLRGSDCKNLEQVVDSLMPIVREMCDSESIPTLSLQKFQKFRDKIAEGNKLVDDHKNSANPVRLIQINGRGKKLDKSINKFIQNELPVVMLHVQAYFSTRLNAVLRLQHVMLNMQVSFCTQMDNVREGVEAVRGGVEAVRERMENVRESVETVRVQVESVGEAVTESVRDGVKTIHDGVETGVQTLYQAVQNVNQVVKNVMSKIEEQEKQISQQNESLCGPPDTPSGFLGFDEHIVNLKNFLLEDGVNVVGVTAMGGAGKSTLAKAVCKDGQIRGYFEERVIYIVASENPDLLSILKTMWKSIVGRSEPHFTNVEDAHDKLESQIKLIKKPTLVVLDDIWSRFDLEKLLFEGEQYKTLATTRNERVLPKGPKTSVYKLPLLPQKLALSLFCHHAFGQPSIPIGLDKELVKEVQQECNGLPLALKVIGRSMCGRSEPSDWERAKNMLSKGEPFDDYHKDGLLHRLKTSIDVLNEDEKQCFLDLVAFPQIKAIPANALLGIWVYVRAMNSDQADMLLGKFADRHLLDLKKNPGAAENTDGCMDAYSFSQHDVMRDLVLYLAKQQNENSTQCRRLFMPKMKNHFPSEWEKDEVLSSKAQIVSIHTGAMKDTDWPKMDFPEVEALFLYFTASEYCIPTFLQTMKKLKVLIIHNNEGAKRSKLSGVADFKELSQLKALHLEKLIVPEECKVLKSLEKIYMSLCEGLGRDKTFNFPELLEFNVSYCIDLEELPAGLCSSASLKKLSVTHCHRLAKLPDEMDKLLSLKQIRLCESPGLNALPSSICKLKKLKFLDISSCMRFKMKRGERCELKETLQTVAKLPSLKHVICDKINEQLFKSASRPDLKVEAIMEQQPSLDWLDLEIWNGRN
ncbi:hypothetical protein SUGI_0902240 [Cryptomeria japonica]|uniref:putative disease resistance protein At5g47280 n=1 Tax=Cryptomeria japonica TaxID=3369 RepID=UPI0024149C2A|nr:putative disease resistance protein At5g47280 [Cryptomeria japonica]GLJ43419.1 hypothetical protein SUGI_0902240 [Cryptomeria japonica]